jgi:hypothetical protein
LERTIPKRLRQHPQEFASNAKFKIAPEVTIGQVGVAIKREHPSADRKGY